MESVPIMDVETLAKQLQMPDPPFLLDVRTGEEREYARIEPSLHIPMQEVPERLEQLPRDRPIVTYCHVGGRSNAVAQFLRQHGYEAINLQGGIEAWSRVIDADVPRY